MGRGVGTSARRSVLRRVLAPLVGLLVATAAACASTRPPRPPTAPTPLPAPAAAAPTAPPRSPTEARAPLPGPEPGGNVLVLSCDELFVEGSAELTASGRDHLRAVAAELAAKGPARVVVRAHSDDDGSVAFNYALSDQRAEAVRTELVAGGLDPSQVRARGLGPKYPIAPNDTPEGRALNRRVTLETRPPGWQPSGVSP